MFSVFGYFYQFSEKVDNYVLHKNHAIEIFFSVPDLHQLFNMKVHALSGCDAEIYQHEEGYYFCETK